MIAPYDHFIAVRITTENAKARLSQEQVLAIMEMIATWTESLHCRNNGRNGIITADTFLATF